MGWFQRGYQLSLHLYPMRSLVPVEHFRNISGHLFNWLVCGSFQWRHGLLFTDCIVWDDKDSVIGFQRSHWIHLGWWSTGSPKLQVFHSVKEVFFFSGGLSLEAINHSSGSSFRDFFVKTTKESLTTLLGPLHRHERTRDLFYFVFF